MSKREGPTADQK